MSVVNAQNYLISFAGTGASNTVGSVKIDNLTAGTTLTISGGDILRLTILTGVNSIESKQSSELKIYPNPMTDYSTLEIYPPASGNATITLSDLNGKQIARIQSYLENYKQELRLSGLKSGFYLVSVKGDSYQYSGKLLCNGKSAENIRIEKISPDQVNDDKITEKDFKGVQATVDMAYTTGDRLKFTGISGIYSTVMTDIPASDKTITFNFLACTDGDNNNYPVVTIGTQTWMAENLKTTKYNDGTGIQLITDAILWSADISGAYCWYNNDPATYKATYGALYNWYTVNTGKLCPTGWHMPTDPEWVTLTTYMGGIAVAGGNLKETGTTHWQSPNTGAVDESGFTALPGGYRNPDGSFGFVGFYGTWWSATVGTAEIAWRMDYSDDDFYSITVGKNPGYSVRCIKD